MHTLRRLEREWKERKATLPFGKDRRTSDIFLSFSCATSFYHRSFPLYSLGIRESRVFVTNNVYFAYFAHSSFRRFPLPWLPRTEDESCILPFIIVLRRRDRNAGQKPVVCYSYVVEDFASLPFQRVTRVSRVAPGYEASKPMFCLWIICHSSAKLLAKLAQNWRESRYDSNSSLSLSLSLSRSMPSLSVSREISNVRRASRWTQRLQNSRKRSETGKREKRRETGWLRETGIVARNGACSSSDLQAVSQNCSPRKRIPRQRDPPCGHPNIKIYSANRERGL